MTTTVSDSNTTSSRALHRTTVHTAPHAVGLRVVPTTRPPAGTDDAPDLSGLVASLGRWYWEVLEGRRDPRQLRRLLSPVCEQRVRAAAQRQHHERRAGRATSASVTAARAVSVRWTGPFCEGVAVVRRAGRSTAVAVTVELHDGRLRVVDLARPEGEQPALRTPTR
jgi:hypothetical protein